MTTYDGIAEWYDNLIETSSLYRDVVLPSLFGLVGDVDGMDVCDLACGQGWIARELVRRGARVTGIELSKELLDMARNYEEAEPLGIQYFQDNAESLDCLPNASFNGVVCTMALMNIEDIGAAASAVRRILKPRGWFVAVITHPCFQTPRSAWVTKPDGGVICEVAAYFDERYWTSENPESLRSRVGDHHRTLSTYLNTFARAGLVLEQIDEPLVSGQRTEEVPGNREVPSICSMRFRAT